MRLREATPRLRPGGGRGNNKRGSMLVIVMVFAAIVAAVLASYLRLGTAALNHADRVFYATAAKELAECGIEEAMAAFYAQATGAAVGAAWGGWDKTGFDATRTFSGFTPGPNASGVVRVYVRNYSLNGVVVIVAKATVTPPRGPAIEKYVEVTAKPRGLFTRGMVAAKDILWSGSVYVDSWNSDPDGDPLTPPVSYSMASMRPNGSVACASAAANAVSIGGASIYGTVATGGGNVQYSASAIVSQSFSGSTVEPGCISQDFSASFPPVTVPVPAAVNLIGSSIMSAASFPRVGDSVAADGRYYYNFSSGSGIVLSGTPVIYINADCVFLMNNHAGSTAIETSGSANISITPGASLTIYTNGDIVSSGQGFLNLNGRPAHAIVYGTKTGSRQNVSISGVGGGGAAFYMPNANFSITGSGEIMGAFIAYSLNVSGSPLFHYDESLASAGAGLGVNVTKWKQLNSAAERATYAAQLAF